MMLRERMCSRSKKAQKKSSILRPGYPPATNEVFRVVRDTLGVRRLEPE
jgi:hypothetical protein